MSTAAAGGGGGSPSSGGSDCRNGSPKFPQFSMVVFFKALPGAPARAPSSGAAPASGASPTAGAKAPGATDGGEHAAGGGAAGGTQVTTRDRIALTVVIAAVLVGGFWFLVLGPQRSKASKLSTQLNKEQQRLTAAQSDVAQSRAALAEYSGNYATWLSWARPSRRPTMSLRSCTSSRAPRRPPASTSAPSSSRTRRAGNRGAGDPGPRARNGVDGRPRPRRRPPRRRPRRCRRRGRRPGRLPDDAVLLHVRGQLLPPVSFFSRLESQIQSSRRGLSVSGGC